MADYQVSNGHFQPESQPTRAAQTVRARADAAPQRQFTAESQANYDRANAGALAAIPLGYGGSLGAFYATKDENGYQRDKRAANAAMVSERQMHPLERVRPEPASVVREQPPAPPPRAAAVNSYDREEKHQPGFREYANQLMFGRAATTIDPDEEQKPTIASIRGGR